MTGGRRFEATGRGSTMITVNQLIGGMAVVSGVGLVGIAAHEAATEDVKPRQIAGGVGYGLGIAGLGASMLIPKGHPNLGIAALSISALGMATYIGAALIGD